MMEWILTSTALILLVIAVRAMFRKRMRAGVMYALWLVVMVRLLCPVNFGEIRYGLLSLAEAGRMRLEEQLEEQKKENVEKAQSVDDLLQNMEIQTELPSEIHEKVPYAPTEQQAEQNRVSFEISRSKLLYGVWLAGMLAVTAVMLGVNLSFYHRLRRGRTELTECAKKGRRGKNIPVYFIESIESPCLFGVFRPAIYLNRNALEKTKQEYCIEHEYSHYLQGDMFWSLCRTACLILHWYNPFVWLAVMLSKQDAELACDERTVERVGEEKRYEYGHALVEMAAGKRPVMQMLGVTTLMSPGKKELVDRVKAITKRKKTRLLAGIVLLCLLVAIGVFVFAGGKEPDNKGNFHKAPDVTVIPDVAGTPEVTQALAPTATPFPSVTPIADRDGNRIRLDEDVTYEPLIFTDHIELTSQEQKGWQLDLNGDGVQDKLYLNQKGLFINEVLVMEGRDVRAASDGENTVWLLDIDTLDDTIEILLNENSLWHYDGNQLQFLRPSLSEPVGYQGRDIRDFLRVDEHTVSFTSYFGVFDEYFLDACYRMNEYGGLQVVAQEYELKEPLLFTYKNETAPFRLYEYRNREGNYQEVTGVRQYTLTKSDGVGWVYLESTDGISGWLYCPHNQDGSMIDSELRLSFVQQKGTQENR